MRIGKYYSGNYLKAIDLPRPALVTIAEVKVEEVGETKEMKAVMYFVSKEKGVVLNKTNFETLMAMFGTDETADWHGRQIVLYNDPSVSFGSTRGGIRIKAPTVQTQAPAAPPPVAPTNPNAGTTDMLDDIPQDEIPF
jgi:hypothetical protein